MFIDTSIFLLLSKYKRTLSNWDIIEGKAVRLVARPTQVILCLRIAE
ncbi:MAG: hypothetical protein PHV07_07575 [Oscillospiraceae bacterium]|nr:hypothetical protein [Oscillospiraceae bacterium]